MVEKKLPGEDTTKKTRTMTEKQVAAQLKREANKKRKEEELKAKKAEQEAKKETRKVSKSRFSMCTKVGQPMATAYKHAMEQLAGGGFFQGSG